MARTYSMTMTAARRKAFARQARARFDRHEAQLRPAVKDAIDGYLAHLRNRLAPHLASLTAAGAPQPAPGPAFTAAMAKELARIIDESASAWQPIMSSAIMPTYQRVMDDILRAGLNDPRVSTDLVAWRNDWLERREQGLVDVPDAISGQLRTTLMGLAADQGTNVASAADAVQAMLDDGYPSWGGRADLIARTETVGANNQGSLASWDILADATGMEATKTWLATSDERTRQDHADVDGTTVGIKDTFDVGGSSMNGPGDEDADADQVCNCRCTMTYDFPDQQGGGNGDSGQADSGEGAAGAEGEAPPEDAGDGQALTAAAAAQSGVAIMLVASQADQQRIAPQGTAAAWPGAHCTLAYLDTPAAQLTQQQQDGLLAALAAAGVQLPVPADAFATAQFNPDSAEREPCAVLLVQSAELDAAKGAVDDACAQALLDQSTAFPIWVPHVAVAYNAAPEDVIDSAALGAVAFDQLVVGWGGQQLVVGAPDPAGDDGAQQLTAAAEAPVTAPAAPTDAPTADANGPAAAQGGDTAAAPAIDLTPVGMTWSGVVAELDTPSSDGRIIASAGLVIRPLPLPLSWQRQEDVAHDGKVEVGRVLAAEVRGTQLWAMGDWYDPMVMYDSQQAMAKVDADMGLVSVDLALLAYGVATADGTPLDPVLYDGDPDDVCMVALESELGGITLVQFPAYATARIFNTPDPENDNGTDIAMEGGPLIMGDPGAFAEASPAAPTISQDGSAVVMEDGTTCAVGDKVDYDDGTGNTVTGTISAINANDNTVTVTPPPASDGTQPDDMTVPVASLSPNGPAVPGKDAPVTAAALTAAAEVRPYNAAYFAKRELSGPTPLTYVPETGEVYGHLATFGECHIGKLAETGACVTAPHSLTEYGDFHLTPIPTNEGRIFGGKITVGTGHAMPGGGFANAQAHYDNTGTTGAFVRAYEDDYGIQLSGQAVHDLPQDKAEAMMMSVLSGDWRMRETPGGANLELCAALCVNTPGFPVRPVVGQRPALGQLSLVAAGAVPQRVGNPRALEHIGLPSGATISRADLEALTAAAVEAVRAHVPVDTANEARQLALRKARAKLALVR